MIRTRELLAWLLLPASLAGQGVVSTFAGADWVFPGGGRPALGAPLGNQVSGIAVDGAGNVYIADPQNHMVFRIANDAQRTLTILAGNGIAGYSGEGGPATAASLRSPVGLALGPGGSIYIADNMDHRIRRVDPDGRIFTVAGNGKGGYSGDGGAAVAASLQAPFGLAVAPDGTLYIADRGNHAIRQVAGGVITTAAGTGSAGAPQEGVPATESPLNSPRGVLIDAESLYITDSGNRRVREVDMRTGRISTIAGTGRPGLNGGTVEGTAALSADLKTPGGIAKGPSGSLYFTDLDNDWVQLLTAGPNRRVALVAGVFSPRPNEPDRDGVPAVQALLSGPRAVAAGPGGEFYVTDTNNGRIRHAGADGILRTIAGQGAYRDFSVTRRQVSNPLDVFLANPAGINFAVDGSMYIADTSNHLVRRISRAGEASIIAGTGLSFCCNNNTAATQASLSFPAGVLWGQQGFLLIADTNSNVIWQVENGVLSNFAGFTSAPGCSGDGQGGNRLQLNGPKGLAQDGSRNLFIADSSNDRIRRIANGPDKAVSTYVGPEAPTCGAAPGRIAPLSNPSGVAFDSNENLYVADTNNHVVRLIPQQGPVRILAGTGEAGYSGDGGQAGDARLNQPSGVAVDPVNGLLYIADTGNNAVRRVRLADGIISTVAGTGYPGLSGDGGPPVLATFRAPRAVAVDQAGDLFISDTDNDRIRRVRFTGLSPALVAPEPLEFRAFAGGAVTAAQTLSAGLSASSQWGLPYESSVTAGGSWLLIGIRRGTLPAAIPLSADPAGLEPGIYQASVLLSTPYAKEPAAVVPVRFVVEPAPAASIRPEPSALAIAVTEGGPAVTRRLVVVNDGGRKAEVKVTAGRTPWVAVVADRTEASNGQPASFSIVVNPAGLTVGTYAADLDVTQADAPGISLPVPVTLTVTRRAHAILTQSALTFHAVAGSSAASVPSQEFGIINGGGATLAFSLQTAPAEAEAWLTVSPGVGAAESGSADAALASVSVRPGDLPPGTYQAEIRVLAPQAANPVQTVRVSFEVRAPSETPAFEAGPRQVAFSAARGGSLPGSETVTLTNLSLSPARFETRVSTGADQAWLTVLPASGALAARGSVRIAIQPSQTSLAPGLRQASVSIFAGESLVETVVVTLLVTGEAGVAPFSRERRAADGCVPQKLFPVYGTVGGATQDPLGQPRSVELRVLDDCGDPLRAGEASSNTATMTFGAEQRPVVLRHLRDGRWQGSWTPAPSSGDAVKGVILVKSPDLGLEARSEQTFMIRPDPEAPRILGKGVTGAGSGAAGRPLAPGGLIVIEGVNLANSATAPADPSLPVTLGGASARIGDKDLVLIRTAPGSIAAMLPFDIGPNSVQQLRLLRQVTRGGRPLVLTTDQPVPVAVAQPWITINGRTPAIYRSGREGDTLLADGVLRAADTILVKCEGLGRPGNETWIAGEPAPAGPRTVANAVTVSLGSATVPAVAELSPVAWGTYDVRFEVPANLEPGTTTLRVISGGQASPAVEIQVR